MFVELVMLLGAKQWKDVRLAIPHQVESVITSNFFLGASLSHPWEAFDWRDRDGFNSTGYVIHAVNARNSYRADSEGHATTTAHKA